MTVLTVICLTYNHKDFILQALESIKMQQTTFDFEVLIADDFSNDGSRELIINFVEKNKEKFFLIPSNENVGSSLNFIRACRLVKSKYIAYLDGDDYWIDEFKLQKQYDILELDSSIACCYHDAILVNGSGDLVSNSYFKNKEKLTQSEIVPYGLLAHSGSVFFRSQSIELIPKWFAKEVYDNGLHLLISEFGSFHFINEPLSAYRFHNGGTWSVLADNKKSLNLFLRLKTYYKSKSFKKYKKEFYTAMASLSYKLISDKDFKMTWFLRCKLSFYHLYYSSPFSFKRFLWVARIFFFK